MFYCTKIWLRRWHFFFLACPCKIQEYLSSSSLQNLCAGSGLSSGILTGKRRTIAQPRRRLYIWEKLKDNLFLFVVLVAYLMTFKFLKSTWQHWPRHLAGFETPSGAASDVTNGTSSRVQAQTSQPLRECLVAKGPIMKEFPFTSAMPSRVPTDVCSFLA